MNDIKACLINCNAYRTHSPNILNRFRGSSDDDKLLVNQCIDLAVELFTNPEPLLQKYLMLILLRDGVLRKSSSLINKIANKPQLLQYFEEVALFQAGSNDPYRAVDLFPNDDPSLSIKYYNLILELIQHLADKFAADKNQKPTKFKMLYDHLQELHVIFTNNTVELDADLYDDKDYQRQQQQQQQQHQQQPQHNSDQDIQQIGELQIQMTDDIQLIYDVLGTTSVDQDYAYEMVNQQSISLQSQVDRLHTILQSAHKSLSQQQREQLDIITDFVNMLNRELKSIRSFTDKDVFILFQHKILEKASEILNRKYVPSQQYQQLEKQQLQSTQFIRQPNQQDNDDDEGDDQQRQYNQQQQEYVNQQKQRQQQQQQQQLQQQQQPKVQQSKVQQYQPKLYDPPQHIDNIDEFQSKTQQSKPKPTFQSLYGQQPLPNSMKLTFGSDMNDSEQHQQKQLDQPIKQEIKQQSFQQINNPSDQYNYEQPESLHPPISQINPATQLYDTTNLSHPSQINKRKGSLIHKLEQAFERLNYTNKQVEQWKRTCLFQDGVLFENDIIMIHTTFTQTVNLLNQRLYLNIKVEFRNKLARQQQINISYQGDPHTQFWVKPTNIISLQDTAHQQIIVGITDKLIEGTLLVGNNTIKFVLPTTNFNFIEFKEIRPEIFKSKQTKVQFNSGQPFHMQITKEGLKFLKFCEISHFEYGAYFDNNLVKLNMNRDLQTCTVQCTNEDLLETLSFLFS